MFGYRKVLVWLLVFGFVVVATRSGLEVPTNNADLVKWVTGLFFAANAAKPALQRVQK